MIIILGIFGVFIDQWSFYAGFLAGIFLKEQISIQIIFGSLIAIIRIFYVVTKGHFTNIHIDRGIMWIVVTMATFAMMIIITRVFTRHVDSFTITLYSNMIGFVISLPAAFILGDPIGINPSMVLTYRIVHGIATLIYVEHPYPLC